MGFTLNGWESIGIVSQDDVIRYSIYPDGYNIPATPVQNYHCTDHDGTCTGLEAIQESGPTWNLAGMAQDTCTQEVHEVSRKEIPYDRIFSHIYHMGSVNGWTRNRQLVEGE